MITAADLGHGYSARDFSVAKEKSAFAETADRYRAAITVDGVTRTVRTTVVRSGDVIAVQLG